MSSPNRIEHLPISFFASVMGMTGLTIAWEKADQVFGLDLGVHLPLLAFSSVLFVSLFTLYGVKYFMHTGAVLAEWKNPVKLSFFPAISISLLLLAVAWLPISEQIGHLLWVAGTTAHLSLTLYVISAWLHHEHFEVHHINPAWFIPAVGNVIVPIAGVPLGYTDLSWFFFSIGILFWLILMVIVFYRMMFHQPLPDKLLPTLFILIAPPAVGFISYLKLNGELDGFARVLYFSGLFLTLMLLTQARRFMRLQFFLSWWAYSFPFAAISIASMVMFEARSMPGYYLISLGLFILTNLIILTLLVLTMQKVGRRQICVPEH